MAAEVAASPVGEALYVLHYRCWDACQDPDDPYGRSPDHCCYSILTFPITKVTAKRIYFCEPRGGGPYDRNYFIDRAKFDAEGCAHHRRIHLGALHLTPPSLPTRPRRKTLSELRREMADAHPDRGGDRDTFMAARARYLAEKARQP